MTVVVETGLAVPVRDGVCLRADLYRPSGPGRYPTALLRTPYDRSLGAAYGQQLNALRLAGAGYAVVLQDVRGRFESDGEFYPFRNEGEDGVDTLEWIVAEPWSNGRIGTLGSSYCGYAQALAARHGHESLECMVPAFAPLDARTGWAYEGGGFCLGFNLSWTLAHIAPRDRRTMQTGLLFDALDEWPETVSRGPSEQRELASTPAADYYFDWLTHMDDDEYWSPLSARGVGGSAPPALVLTGWFDLFAKSSFELYSDLSRADAGAHRLIVGPWDHSPLPLASSAGETEFGVAAALDLHDLQRQWLDTHLRDEDEPDWPAARVFTTGSNHWEEWTQWPPPASTQSWYLGAQRDLSPAPAASTTEERFTVRPQDPTPTLGGPLCCWKSRLPSGQVDQHRRAERADVLTFSSGPLDRELALAGSVSAEIWSGSSSVGADVFVTLVDVDQSGRGVNIAEGLRRRADAGSEPARFDVDLGHVAHEFGVGHQIRLDVSAMSFPRFDRLAAQPEVERTVAIGPSRLLLPVLS